MSKYLKLAFGFILFFAAVNSAAFAESDCPIFFQEVSNKVTTESINYKKTRERLASLVKENLSAVDSELSPLQEDLAKVTVSDFQEGKAFNYKFSAGNDDGATP